MAANRSSVVRVRDGVGVTMFSSDAPLADGAGDDSAVLESNTSPEKEKLHTHSYGRVNTHTHTHTHFTQCNTHAHTQGSTIRSH